MSHKALDGNGTLIDVYSLDAADNLAGIRMVNMDYQTSLVDAGVIFGLSGRIVLANNGIADFLLKTHATIHTEWYVLDIDTASSPLVVDVYEGAIVSANGTNVSNGYSSGDNKLSGFINYDRQSSNSCATLAYMSPTVTDDGGVVHTFIVSGEKSIGGGNGAAGRLILKSAENYLLRISNESGASAKISMRMVIGQD